MTTWFFTLYHPKTIEAFGEHPSEFSTMCSVAPLEKNTEPAILLMSDSSTTIFDKNVALTLMNATKSP